ncbi:glycoside hydrolase family 2 TIM barrel-domain containing protein [Compostibacter hankyongensis]|uniref:Glycoside hydrolase family 2 TIM barrel-domain containing protein n=1 Tax=Compostibacter hankyongensis TaxID=1007089 RepID=A0ABP8FNM6_9BACT
MSRSLRAQAETGDAVVPSRVISLAGIWNFRLDPLADGIPPQGSPLARKLPEFITLPGSTDQAGKGIQTKTMTSLRLTRAFAYSGAAWYEKKIDVPAGWKGKIIQLFLERAHWETRVWVNGQAAGKKESLSVPHVYDLTGLIQPGRPNTIRIRVDNGRIYDIGFPHAISAETQTNWNGIVGKMELRAFDPVHIRDVQVYPEPLRRQARVKITIANDTRQPVAGTLALSARPQQAGGRPSIKVAGAGRKERFSGSGDTITVTTLLKMGDSIRLWDEFDPALYALGVNLETQTDSSACRDSRTVTFGMRQFSLKGTHFAVNDRITFIRADVNSAEFPLTGYPATDTAYWGHVFRTCKAYGLNAMRFHSWCPPEAAFEAADRTGIYLQVENSDWRFNIGRDPAADSFLTAEADRILQVYGNHPSFMLFCEGNELVGPNVKPFLSGLLRKWKQQDPRHLYTSGSGYPSVPENQYEDFYGPRYQHWKEGLKGRMNARAMNTDFDYKDYVGKFSVPLISHEVGQWCVYPDFSQIPKYTGVLKPYNYELFRESLRNHHMLDQARAFTRASGRFQVILKKEEMEALLRTPGLGGFQLLQLQDFPGQGTAPVGVVDDFWDPKFYADAAEFHAFQSARVPLLRAAAFTWTNDQVFTAKAELANYGSGTLHDAALRWELQYPDGRVYAAGRFDRKDIPVGDPVSLGALQIPLQGIQKAVCMKLVIDLKGTPVRNSWHVWVYPARLPAVSRKGVTVTDKWNEKTKRILQQGGSVLLLGDTSRLNDAISPSFSGISWNTVWSGMPPDLMGILCDPQHPALQAFPTAFHSDWQWWDLVSHSRPMWLDSMPSALRPLVQMIPDWNRNYKIALIFEARVGKGKLLMCSIDLLHDMERRPVARQLLYSLERYVTGDDFKPELTLLPQQVDRLFDRSLRPAATAAGAAPY